MSKTLIQPINLSRHLPAILKIEQECHIDAWDAEIFNRTLSFKNNEGIVIYFENELAGYCIYEKTKAGIRILNLSVAPWRQRFGLGTALLDVLKQWAQPEGLLEMKLSDRCLDAHLFLAKQGFKAEKVIENFFRIDDDYEDAYCFVYRMPSKSNAKPIIKNINVRS
jgi:ribosomal-protein-alanine N-acetyltransferase